jgi:hypothetical protein
MSEDRERKNEQQYTKILLFKFVEGSEWEEESSSESWKRKAVPVYRTPQSTWAPSESKERWLYFIKQIFFGSSTVFDGTKINDLRFPEWIQARWDSQSGRWLVIDITETKWGKTKTAGVGANSSGVVLLDEPTTSSWATSTVEITAYNRGAAIPGSKLILLKLIDGRWCAFQVEC